MSQLIERLLWSSRLMIIPAVFASILAALVLILIGTYNVGLSISYLIPVFTAPELFDPTVKKVIIAIITAVDIYLIATVLLIFGIGLYELFVSKLELAESSESSSQILIIKSLDQLKEKLANVIIMVLIVTFFKEALNLKFTDAVSLLYLGAGIFLIALSVLLISKKGKADLDEKS